MGIAVDTLYSQAACSRKGSREFFQTSSVKRIRAKSDFVCASLHTEKDNSTDFQQALRTKWDAKKFPSNGFPMREIVR